MAARAKATDKVAESTTTDDELVEEASKALNESLAQADPKDSEQPTPAPAPAEASAEKPKKAPLSLNETRGEVKDGEKVYIGVEIWKGDQQGKTQNAPFVIPTNWIIAGPASRPTNVHAINTDLPKTTLCRLPTNWTSGIAKYPDDTFLTCEPCARRLIIAKKLTQADHDKRREAATKAREDAQKALAARLAAEKQAKADAKKAEADKAKAAPAPAPEAPAVETPAEAPKEDAAKAETAPKRPSRARRRNKPAQAA